jgi:hypothetical protein
MLKPLFIVLSLVLNLSAFATSVQVMTVQDVQHNSYDKTDVDFVVNSSREALVQVRLLSYKPGKRQGYRSVRTEKEKIEGLLINDNNELKFGHVVCGTVKFRRFLGPKIMPSGNCTFKSKKTHIYDRDMGPRTHIEVFVVTE